jgi:hypothetical protein
VAVIISLECKSSTNLSLRVSKYCRQLTKFKTKNKIPIEIKKAVVSVPRLYLSHGGKKLKIKKFKKI